MELWCEKPFRKFSITEIPQGNFSPLCPLEPLHTSQEFPALAIRKLKELQSRITGEKQLLYFLSVDTHGFS